MSLIIYMAGISLLLTLIISIISFFKIRKRRNNNKLLGIVAFNGIYNLVILLIILIRLFLPDTYSLLGETFLFILLSIGGIFIINLILIFQNFSHEIHQFYHVNPDSYGIICYATDETGLNSHVILLPEGLILNRVEIEKAGVYYLTLLGAGHTYHEGGYGPVPFGDSKTLLAWLYTVVLEAEARSDPRIQKRTLVIFAFIFSKELKYKIVPETNLDESFDLILSSIVDIKEIDDQILRRIEQAFVYGFTPSKISSA